MSKPTDKNAPHILIADDSIVCRSVLVILLENSGYRVTSVLDGIQALEALRKDTFELAILDNEMPNLDGISALAELRNFLPDLPVVICSGTVTPEQAVRYTQLRISDLFDKPVDPRKLRDKVAVILEQRRQRAATHSQTSPGFVISEKDQALNKPFFAGTSKLALKFRDDFIRVREFRSAAILEGKPGSGLLELAFSISPEAQTLVVATPSEALDSNTLLERFAPATATKQPILLVVTHAEHLSAEQQDLLESFFAAKPTGPFAAFSGRIRLVLCAEASLNDLADSGEFNELLLMRAGAMILRVPSLKQRVDDLAPISRAIVRRIGGGSVTLDEAGGSWIERQPWPGDYLQLHRALEIAVRLAAGKAITAEHLAAATTQEAAFKDPLYHELLPAKVASRARA